MGVYAHTRARVHAETQTQALAHVGKYSVTQLHPRPDGLYSAFTDGEMRHRIWLGNIKPCPVPDRLYILSGSYCLHDSRNYSLVYTPWGGHGG